MSQNAVLSQVVGSLFVSLKFLAHLTALCSHCDFVPKEVENNSNNSQLPLVILFDWPARVPVVQNTEREDHC